jgi:regulator of sirC expression with transglutaminase-like and TPR domain
MLADIETLGLLDDDEIELDHAALILSELDHPGLDIEPSLLLIDDIGDRLFEIGGLAETPARQAEALAQVFYGEFGFTGDAEHYDAPLNGDLVRVLERRRGLPVSLSILYVAAARRLGWEADALNTPGHVLVRVGDEGSVLIDPFNHGVRVPPQRLAALLRGAVGPVAASRAEHIAPMSNRIVLVRLLLNQATRAEQGGDPLRALTIYERMTTVAPDHADGWWELARLQLQVGDTDAARHSLTSMLEVTRDTKRRQLVAATLEAIAAG